MDDDYIVLGRSSDEDWSRGDGGSIYGGASDGGRPAPVGGSASGLRMPTSWTAAAPQDEGGPSSLRAPTAPHVSGSRPSSPVHDTTRNRLSGTKEKEVYPTPPSLPPSSPSTFRITIPPSTPPRSRSPSLRRESGSFVIAGLEYLQALEPSDLWLMLYFCAAAALPIYNKALLRGFFPFPWILTANQMACSSLGTIAAAKVCDRVSGGLTRCDVLTRWCPTVRRLPSIKIDNRPGDGTLRRLAAVQLRDLGKQRQPQIGRGSGLSGLRSPRPCFWLIYKCSIT